MFNDTTSSDIRRDFVAQNTAAVQSDDPAQELARLEAKHGAGNVWNTEQLSTLFSVESFLAPFCVVKRRSDGKKGVVEFQHSPRFYFNFSPL